MPYAIANEGVELNPLKKRFARGKIFSLSQRSIALAPRIIAFRRDLRLV